MSERVYNQPPDKLRSADRVKRLEVEKVVGQCLETGTIKTLLDIGTGSGLFAEAFQRKGITVNGVDINSEMITAAKAHVPDAEFLVAPAEHLPYADGSFDAAFFGVVFHEVSDYAKALSEASRVTRSRAFILEWQYKTEEFGPPLEHRLTEQMIRELARSSGYRYFTSTPLATLVLYTLSK